jgi:hypothetical protein
MRGNAVRALLYALAVLGLLGLVAIAAGGSTSTGSSDTRRPSYVLFDTALGLALVALIASVALIVYAFAIRTPTGFERQRGGLAAIAAIIVFAAVIGTSDVPAWLQSRLSQPNEERTAGATPNVPEAALPPDRPGFTWLPFAVIVALAAIVAAATLLADRRRRGTQVAREGVEEAVVDVLDDILDDLRAEADARRAVIAAHARRPRRRRSTSPGSSVCSTSTSGRSGA